MHNDSSLVVERVLTEEPGLGAIEEKSTQEAVQTLLKGLIESL